jgi:hypothetical protein
MTVPVAARDEKGHRRKKMQREVWGGGETYARTLVLAINFIKVSTFSDFKFSQTILFSDSFATRD